MSKDYSKNDYQMLLAAYQEARELYPKKVENDAYYSLMQLGKIRVEGLKKFENSLFGICATAIGIINIISSFFLGPVVIPIVLFGFAFFLAGYYVGTQPNGLLGIYAHGLVGFCIMNGYPIFTIFNNPIMNSRPPIIIGALALGFIIQFIGLVYAALYNFSDTLKGNIINKNIPIMLATLATFIFHLTAILIKTNIL